MKKLLSYLNSLIPSEQSAFAARCETTVGYLRKAISVNQLIREALCINIERESGGAVRCEDLRADVDWDFIRGTDRTKAQQTQAQAAPETVAPPDANHTGPDLRQTNNPPHPDHERRAPLAAALAGGGV